MWKRWNQTTHMWERSTNNGSSWSILPINLSVEGVTNNTGLAHGTYVPVASNPNNVSGLGTRTSAYMRVGNVITVSGLILFTITVSGAFSFNINIPINSNLPGDGTGGNGTFAGAGSPVYASLYSAGANSMLFSGFAHAAGAIFGSFHFTYRVI